MKYILILEHFSDKGVHVWDSLPFVCSSETAAIDYFRYKRLFEHARLYGGMPDKDRYKYISRSPAGGVQITCMNGLSGKIGRYPHGATRVGPVAEYVAPMHKEHS